MTFTLPDGVVVEYVVADSYGGPNNCYSRQNVNSQCVWWRCAETDECSAMSWERSSHRNLCRFMDWILMCESFSDFLEGEK